MRTRTQIRAWKQAVEHTRVVRALVQDQVQAQPPAEIPAQNTAPDLEQAKIENVVPDQFVTPTKKRRAPTPGVDVDTIEHLSPQARKPKRRCITKTSKSPRKPSLKRALACSLAVDADSDDATANITVSENVKTPRMMLQYLCGQQDAQQTAPIVGRDLERKQVHAVFGPSKLHSDRVVFLIGPPGTGKSSCVDAIAREHEATTTSIRLNCSTFSTAASLYDALRREMRTRKMAWEFPMQLNATDCTAFVAAARQPQGHSTSDQRWVIVLDELDQMLRVPEAQRKTIDQLLRFLVQCVQLPGSSLRLVGIMNAVHGHTQLDDLLAPDGHRPTFVMFPSYSYAEITSILQAYVVAATGDAGIETIVEPRALEIIARKIAARDGDARRAIRILQQSARSCLQDETLQQPKITLRQALSTWNATLAPSATAIKQIEQLPRVSKLVLAIVARLTPNEGDRTNLQAVRDELQYLQSRSDLPWIPSIPPSDMEQQLGSLECLGLIKQGAAKNRRTARISASVATPAIHHAFQSDPLLAELLGPSPTTELAA